METFSEDNIQNGKIQWKHSLQEKTYDVAHDTLQAKVGCNTQKRKEAKNRKKLRVNRKGKVDGKNLEGIQNFSNDGYEGENVLK